MARETGWTLDYIESLPIEKYWEYLSILDAEAKVTDSLRKQRRG